MASDIEKAERRKRKQEKEDDPRKGTMERLAWAGVSAVAVSIFGPPLHGPHLDPLAGVSAVAMFSNGMRLLDCGAAHFLGVARTVKAHTPTKTKGQKKLKASARQLSAKVSHKDGLYIGAGNGTVLRRKMAKSLGLVVGPNSSGKDMRLQQIMAATCNASFATIDIGSEGTMLQTAHLKKRGYQVHTVDLGNEFPGEIEQSTLNPHDLYAHCLTKRNQISYIFEDGARFWNLLVPIPPGTNEPVWPKGAQKHANTLSIGLALEKGFGATITDVRERSSSKTEIIHMGEYLTGQLETVQPDGSTTMEGFPYDTCPYRTCHDPALWDGFVKAFKAACQELLDLVKASQKEGRMWDGYLQEISNGTQPFTRNSRIHQMTCKSSFDIHNLATPGQKTAVFFTASQARGEYQFKVLGLLMSVAMRSVLIRDEDAERSGEGNLVYFFIGESNLINLGKGLKQFTLGARKFGGRVLLFPQSLSGLDDLYGKKMRQTLTAEADFSILLPGVSDTDTLEWFEHLSSEETWIEKSQTLGVGAGVDVTSESVREARKPVVPKSKMREMKDGRAFLFIGNEVTKIDVPFYSEIWPLQHLFSPNPRYGPKKWRRPIKLILPRRMTRRVGPRPQKEAA